MSSKFSRYPTPRLTPSICASFAGSCIEPFPLYAPPALWAYIVWVDLDPLDPIHGVGWARLLQVGPGPEYYGISSRSTVQVAARVRPAVTPLEWFINTILHYHDHEPANWTWGAHFIDPREPFDTGLLTHVHLPGLDFKKVHIAT